MATNILKPTKILLIGPSFSGKTHILYSANEQEVPETEERGTLRTNETTIETGILGIATIKAIEVGGNDENLIIVTENEFKSADYVLFVFDGKMFIDQVSHPEKGNEIYARWLHYNQMFGDEEKWRRAYIVATHADQVENIGEKIRQHIDEANKQYNHLLGDTGIERYKSSLFKSPFFHCINANNFDDVKKLFQSIKQ